MAPPRSWVTDFAVWDRVLVPGTFDLLPNAVHWWDFSNAGSRVDIGGGVSTITDLINGAVMAATSANARVTTVGGQGLTSVLTQPSGGGAPHRMSTTALVVSAVPFGVSWIGRIPNVGGGTNGVYFQFSSAAGAPGAYSFGNQEIGAGTALVGPANDGADHIFYAEFNGASSKLYIDGSLAASGNTGSGVPNANGTLFNVTGGGVGGNIYIGELVICTGTQTGGDITAEYNRLADKWI